MNGSINILWAVNPVDLDEKIIAEVELLLAASVQRIKIFPVYVASPYDLQIDNQVFKNSFSSFRKGVRLKLRSLFKSVQKANNLSEVKVLSDMGANVESAVDKLLDYSKKLQADFILVGLAQKNLRKKQFGSFSRTLLKRTTCPSITLGLKKASGDTLRPHLLLAIDLSHESMLDVIKFSFLSKQLGSALTLIRKADSRADATSRKRLEQFSRLAKKCGVQATYAHLRKGNPSADELANYAAKNNFIFLGLSCSVLNSV